MGEQPPARHEPDGNPVARIDDDAVDLAALNPGVVAPSSAAVVEFLRGLNQASGSHGPSASGA